MKKRTNIFIAIIFFAAIISIASYSPITSMFKHTYYIDATETDQGAAGNGNSAYDIILAKGASKSITLVFEMTDTVNNTTVYTWDTSVSIPANYRIVIKKGAVLTDTADEDLTINGPFEAGLYQVFDWSGTGNVSFAAGSADTYTAAWFGLDGGGAVDNQPALTKATAAVPTYGILTIPIPATSYALNSTWVIDKSIRVVGKGVVYTLKDASAIYGVKFLWTGGASSMVTTSDSYSTFLENIALDCDGTATYGWNADRLVHGGADNLVIFGAATYCLRLDADTATANDNSDWNNFSNLILQGAGNIHLDGNGSNANSCHNTFQNVCARYTGDYGIYLDDCDNNRFYNVFLTRSAGGGKGVYVDARGTSNYFYHLQPSTGGMEVTGSANAGIVVGYDMTNGQPAPTIGAGSYLDYTTSGHGSTGWYMNKLSSSTTSALEIGSNMDIDGEINLNNNYLIAAQNLPDFLCNNKPSYWLDGVNDKITVADNNNLSFGDGLHDSELSLEWAGVINEVETGSLMSKAGGDEEYYMGITPSSRVTFYCIDDSAAAHIFFSSDDAISDGDAHNYHIVGTYDATENMDGLTLYINGEAIDITPALTGSYTAMENLAADLEIGFDGWATYLDGEVRIMRVWNIELSADEVKSLLSGASIPFKYIGASQTEFFTTAIDRTFTGGATHWADNDIGGSFGETTDLSLVATATGQYCKITFTDIGTSLEQGKQYRLEYDYSETTAGFEFKLAGAATQTLGDAVDGTYQTIEFTADEDYATTDELRIYSKTNSDATGDFDNFSLKQIGCVLDLNQSGIGHNQWQDASGNQLVGTVSGAIPINLPVDHQEVYLDLTLTGDDSFTLTKGYKITSIIVKETAANALTGGLDVGTSAGGVEVVSGMAVGANATVNCTLVAAGTIGATFTTADDTIYFSDGNDDANWDSASLEVRVQMQRLTVN